MSAYPSAMRSHCTLPHGTLLMSASVYLPMCTAMRWFFLNSKSISTCISLLPFLPGSTQTFFRSWTRQPIESIDHSLVVDQLTCSKFGIAYVWPVAMSAVPLKCEIEPQHERDFHDISFQTMVRSHVCLAWVPAVRFSLGENYSSPY